MRITEACEGKIEGGRGAGMEMEWIVLEEVAGRGSVPRQCQNRVKLEQCVKSLPHRPSQKSLPASHQHTPISRFSSTGVMKGDWGKRGRGQKEDRNHYPCHISTPQSLGSPPQVCREMTEVEEEEVLCPQWSLSPSSVLGLCIFWHSCDAIFYVHSFEGLWLWPP